MLQETLAGKENLKHSAADETAHLTAVMLLAPYPHVNADI